MLQVQECGWCLLLCCGVVKLVVLEIDQEGGDGGRNESVAATIANPDINFDWINAQWTGVGL